MHSTHDHQEDHSWLECAGGGLDEMAEFSETALWTDKTKPGHGRQIDQQRQGYDQSSTEVLH